MHSVLELTVAYGLTECSPCVSISGEYCYKKGSVGKPITGCHVEIIDDEIVVSGENVMLGYYNEYNDTSSALRCTKLYTGDLGYIDEEGFLFLIGRKSNIIVFSDGNKINIEDLERDLNSVFCVIESLVFQVRNSDKIRIILVSKEKQNEVVLAIKSVLIKYDIVHCVQDIFVQNIPLKRTDLGKIIRDTYYYNF